MHSKGLTGPGLTRTAEGGPPDAAAPYAGSLFFFPVCMSLAERRYARTVWMMGLSLLMYIPMKRNQILFALCAGTDAQNVLSDYLV